MGLSLIPWHSNMGSPQKKGLMPNLSGLGRCVYSLEKGNPWGSAQRLCLYQFSKLPFIKQHMKKGDHTYKALPELTIRQPADGHSRSVETIPHVLTVAGSDSGAGAGIQADLKACGALGVYCSTVITAVTAQNTIGVQSVNLIPVDAVLMQLESVLSDMDVDVVKTGVLPSIQIIHALCSKLKSHRVQGVVVDPVMVSTSGDTLAGSDILDVLRKELFPMADIVTPNMKEASILLGGIRVDSLSDMREAAKAIHKFGSRYVLIKGGHLLGSEYAVDVLYDGHTLTELQHAHVNTRNTHGTGCTLASSIAAEMAKGAPVPLAVQAAKDYVQEALVQSKKLSIGKGSQGPLHHFFRLTEGVWKLSQKQFKPSNLLLYAVTDSNMNKCWQRSTCEAVKAAIQGGATIIQLREKEAESGELLKEALSCVKIAQEYGVPLLINDRLDIAMACDADGVHLGQSDIPISYARALLGPTKIIGASCKTPQQAQKAFKDGADYVGSGGVYPTTTKKSNETIGLDGLRRVCEESPLPVVAIGGINNSNVEDILQNRPQNLHGVAVVSALFDKPDVLKEASELSRILSRFFAC